MPKKKVLKKGKPEYAVGITKSMEIKALVLTIVLSPVIIILFWELLMFLFYGVLRLFKLSDKAMLPFTYLSLTLCFLYYLWHVYGKVRDVQKASKGIIYEFKVDREGIYVEGETAKWADIQSIGVQKWKLAPRAFGFLIQIKPDIVIIRKKDGSTLKFRRYLPSINHEEFFKALENLKKKNLLKFIVE